jgi:hypothetical protein
VRLEKGGVPGAAAWYGGDGLKPCRRAVARNSGDSELDYGSAMAASRKTAGEKKKLLAAGVA